MIIPIRCFSCGKPIAHLYEPYEQMLKEGVPIEEIWPKLGISRFCCQRMLASHVNIIDDLLNFNRLQ
ncbi:MAG: DNA-directed RNA polymerase subunit N [Promethearchaeota archaeon]